MSVGIENLRRALREEVILLHPEDLVENSGFEAGELEPWKLAVWAGTVDECVVQGEAVKQGRYAVKMRSDAGADAALQQRVKVDPMCWYRLSAWVKTVGVEEVDAKAYTILGATELDRSGEWAGRLCFQDSPVKLLGDNEWTYVELVFKTTPYTYYVLVEPALSFGGKSKGTVYWDEVKLEKLSRPPEITPKARPVFITNMGLGTGFLVYGKSIKADSYSDPISVYGYTRKTLMFLSDAAGDLTIEADVYGDGDWQEYDVVSVTANKPLWYTFTGDMVRVRLKFSANATATAKLYLDRH